MRRGDPALALVASAIVLAVAAVAAPAHAYCRTSSCNLHPMARVHTAGAGRLRHAALLGQALRGMVASEGRLDAGDVLTGGADRHRGLRDLDERALPRRGTPRINLTEAEPAECHQHEYNRTASNANVIMFHDTGWSEGRARPVRDNDGDVCRRTGEIYDADMEINSTDNQFTTGDTGVVVDLPSIVTHEMPLPRALALAERGRHHVPQLRSGDDYAPGPIGRRHRGDSPSTAGHIPSGCDPTPRHGFSALCRVDQPRVSAARLPPDAGLRDHRREGQLPPPTKNEHQRGANALLAIGNRGQSRVAVAFDLSTINTSAVRARTSSCPSSAISTVGDRAGATSPRTRCSRTSPRATGTCL
jgi:hypothetical protein